MTSLERSIFILAEPGPLREALTALVTSLPAGTGIYLDDMVVQAMVRMASIQPNVLLLDDDLLPGQLADFMTELRGTVPATLVMLLASTIQREQEALRVGAAASLVKGTPVERLTAVLEELLDQDIDHRMTLSHRAQTGDRKDLTVDG